MRQGGVHHHQLLAHLHSLRWLHEHFLAGSSAERLNHRALLRLRKTANTTSEGGVLAAQNFISQMS
jgi:hypothetical protein